MIGSEAQLDEWVLASPSSGTVHGGINITDSQQYGAHNEVSVFSCESGFALHCIAIPSTEYFCDHQTLNL